MSIIINGEEYHRTAEACRIAGTSKNTFLRWVREGTISDVSLRDRRGWRLFSWSDIDRLRAEANRIIQPVKADRSWGFKECNGAIAPAGATLVTPAREEKHAGKEVQVSHPGIG